MSPRRGSGPPATGDHPVILIAEHDPYAAELAEFFLRTEGYEVVRVLDTHAAQAEFDARTPALVVVELLISGGVGADLCRALKADRDVPVVVVSSLEAHDEAAAAGAGRVPLQAARPVGAGVDGQGPPGLERLPAVVAGERRALMPARLSSGNDKLDGVLEGGLCENAINLVTGVPGTGKTILAQQYVFHNATDDRPALYFSTISEPLEKLIRYGQELDFFDGARVGRSVFYEDASTTLDAGGLVAFADRIDALLKERRPGLLVIDSFRALRAFAGTDAEFRHFLHNLAGRLSAFPVSSFWVGEYGFEELGTAPEFAVADGIVHLSLEQVAEREMRDVPGPQAPRERLPLGEARCGSRARARGLPRLADPGSPTEEGGGDEKISSGIEALDEMLVEGLWPGSSTSWPGPPAWGRRSSGSTSSSGVRRRTSPASSRPSRRTRASSAG